jgi:hypothetical protein
MFLGSDGCAGLVGGHLWYVGEEGVEVLREGLSHVYSAGMFKQSMKTRNRVGIGLSYRPARLHRLAVDSFESNPGLLESLKIRALKTKTKLSNFLWCANNRVNFNFNLYFLKV